MTFYTVDHVILNSKGNAYGLRGPSLQLSESYLSNRKQFLVSNQAISHLRSIAFGVPQGSGPQPLLLIIFTNKMAIISEVSKTVFLCT